MSGICGAKGSCALTWKLTCPGCAELRRVLSDALTIPAPFLPFHLRRVAAFARQSVCSQTLNADTFCGHYILAFSSDLDNCTSFGIVYVSNERHLQADETEMKRWKINRLEDLEAGQCQMTGFHAKQMRSDWGANSM
jgi:hypothetical protein